MAQNITLLGASYSDVPAVTLPKTGGGAASFTDVTDTTAAAADVATGKYFYTSAGVRTQGTNSGGGGGATNFVTGTFTVGTTTGTAESHTINYTGSGYPIAGLFFIEGGAYNNTSSGDTTWYNSTQRYAIGVWGFSKSNTTTTPTWATSGAANQCVTFGIYTNNASTATSYSRTSAMNTVVLTSSSSSAGNSVANAVKFKGDSKTISVYVASTSYGFLAGHTYRYILYYSS